MHNAPAVSYPVGRSRFHAVLICCASFIGAAALLAWAIQTDQTHAKQTGAGLVWLLSSAWAAFAWRRTPTGVLQFTGDVWNWTSPAGAQPVTIDLALDLQRTLLVVARGTQSRARWLWLEQGLLPQRWIHLRRAVYAARRPSGRHDKPGAPA